MEIRQESKDIIEKTLFLPFCMKKSETRDSISSVDSDVSLSFDRRGSKSEEADLSDYDNEIKSMKEINIDQDSGADSVDDTLKELEQKNLNISLDTPVEKVKNIITLNDELADKICTQVEFYFSDENIIKDAFLLKHVKKNKEGYVSLKLISSFKRIKHLSRDWRVIRAALTRSKKLEINPQGTKLRRVEPLPPFDQTMSSRTILVARLPIKKLTVESVAEIFKSYGEIALIRVLRPGYPAPSEVRQAISRRPELSANEEYAMIEFTESSSARNAMQMVLDDAKIFELHQSTDKKKKHQVTKKSTFKRVAREDNYNSSSCLSGSEPEDERVRHKKSIQRSPMYDIHTNCLLQGSSMACVTDCYITTRRKSADCGPFLRRFSTYRRDSDEINMRRLSLCSLNSEQNKLYRLRSNNNIAMTHLPENVMRMPSGPNGTRGFFSRSENAD